MFLAVLAPWRFNPIKNAWRAWRLGGSKEIFPLLPDLILQLFAGFRDGRKLVQVIVRPARIDDGLRAQRRVVAVGAPFFLSLNPLQIYLSLALKL